jgi:nucleoid DNA-binding protein
MVFTFGREVTAMIKADIVKKIADHLKIRDKEALVIVDSTIEAMKKIVADHGRLEIRDFGVFQTKTRKERVGRNPKDKKEYPIPARRVVTFKMGRELKVSGEKGDGEVAGGVSGNGHPAKSENESSMSVGQPQPDQQVSESQSAH